MASPGSIPKTANVDDESDGALIENRWRPHLFVMPIRNFRTNNPERILNPVNDQVVACYAQAVDRVEVCQPDY